MLRLQLVWGNLVSTVFIQALSLYNRISSPGEKTCKEVSKSHYQQEGSVILGYKNGLSSPV